MLFQVVDDLCHGGSLLTDSNVYANHVLTLLVDHGVNRNGCFARLSVADNQLTLSASYGEHGVDGENTRLQRLGNALSDTNACRFRFNREKVGCVDRTLAVNRRAERVNDASYHFFSDGNAGSFACAHHLGAFVKTAVAAEQHHAHIIFGNILNNTLYAGIKLYQLSEHHLFKSEAVYDTVVNRKYRAALVYLELYLEVRDFFLYHRNDIGARVLGRGSFGKVLFQTF